MYIRLLLIYFLILMNLPLWGQQNNVYTDLYSTYFNNLALINPAFIPREGKADLLASYKNRTGPFRKIATYSFTASRIFRKESNTAHVARAIFWNEREGPYIQKPRGYINYAYELPLSSTTSIAAGLALGFAQISFSAPSATGTGSATLPDGSLGLLFKGKKFSAGASSMQLFNSGSEAIKASVRLRRFYNFFLSADIDLSPVWSLKGYGLWRLLPSANDNGDLALLLSYKDAFSFGSSAKYKQGLSFFLSFNINMGNDRLLISFAYNSPVLSRNNTLLNSLETTAGYIIR